MDGVEIQLEDYTDKGPQAASSEDQGSGDIEENKER